MASEAINPTTGEAVRYDEHSSADVEAKLRQAEHAFSQWREVPLSERSQAMSARQRA